MTFSISATEGCSSSLEISVSRFSTRDTPTLRFQSRRRLKGETLHAPSVGHESQLALPSSPCLHPSQCRQSYPACPPLLSRPPISTHRPYPSMPSPSSPHQGTCSYLNTYLSQYSHPVLSESAKELL